MDAGILEDEQEDPKAVSVYPLARRRGVELEPVSRLPGPYRHDSGPVDANPTVRCLLYGERAVVAAHPPRTSTLAGARVETGCRAVHSVSQLKGRPFIVHTS